MTVRSFVDQQLALGKTPEQIKLTLARRGFRASLPALRSYARSNPACKKAGMSKEERSRYNKEHHAKVRRGVTSFEHLEDLRRWGSWARRFYGKRKKSALIEGDFYTPLACSALAWGRNPPNDWLQAGKIAKDGAHALEIYSVLKESLSPRHKFSTKMRSWLNKTFLDFTKRP